MSNMGIAAESDDDPRFGDRRCSTIRFEKPQQGRYHVLLEGFVDTKGKFELAYSIESPSGKAATPTPSKGHLTAQLKSSGTTSTKRELPAAAVAGVGTAFALAVLIHLWGPGLFS